MKKIMSTICASELLVLLFAQAVLASSYSTYLKMSGGTYQYMSNNYRSFYKENY